MPSSRGKLPDDTYIELIQRLSSTLVPTVIMSAIFAAVGVLLAHRAHDLLLMTLAQCGMLASLLRVAILLLHRRAAAGEDMIVPVARRLERRFAIGYYIFAAILALFAVRGFALGDSPARTLLVELLFGYGAGVAMGLSSRPWIGVPSMLIAIVPMALEALIAPDLMTKLCGVLLAAFLAGGIQAMIARCRFSVQGVTMRRQLARLARNDNLTGLANRLSLEEAFARCCARGGNLLPLAVHCLDLDRFKAVNDRYGHPTGDRLLKAVAERLQRGLRTGDVAARVGGDEFIVLQPGVHDADAAELLARRIARDIAQPFMVDGTELRIGTSVGFALSARSGLDLDVLVASADRALCAAKRRGGGVASWQEEEQEEEEEEAPPAAAAA